MALQILAGEKQKGESARALQACNDYLRMGPGRSLRALAVNYSETQQNTTPTRSPDTLFQWSTRFDWQSRAELYDEQLEAAKNARRAEIMASGLALDYERVIELKDLTAFLKTQLYEQGEAGAYHNVWLPDVKQIGSGDSAERVDIVRFNGAIFEQYRGALDDLAKETGGRKQRSELTGANGGPIETRDVSLTAEQIDAELLALLGPTVEQARDAVVDATQRTTGAD